MSENTESEFLADGGQWPKLAVKNFGPIAEGEVELRPLTVFAGPSNTGKSWLAMLIYAMTRHISAGYGLRRYWSRVRLGMTDPDDKGLENFPENPVAWLQNICKGKTLRLTNGDKQILKSILEGGQEALKEEILRCFGLTEARGLVREKGGGTTNVTFLNVATPASFTAHRHLTVTRKGGFSLGADVMTDECRPPPHLLDILKEMLENLQDADPDGEQNKIHSRYMRAQLFGFLVDGHWYSSTHYLPADRGGVMHAHRVVVGALIQSASRAGLTHRSPLPTLSGVLGDFLEQLIELAGHEPKHPSTENPSADPAGSLEQEVLGGKIEVKKSDVGYPHFTYRPDGWKRDLSFMSVSSMVSELAPLALYLRHCVRQGDLLILEEPEAHLHPEMQVRLVREIAGWVRQGIRVLITTHSEWVIEAIANIVAEAETGKKDGLLERSVGVWRFDMNTQSKTSGSQIRKVEWDPDEGGFLAGFDVVAGDLMNAWADLLEETE